MATVQFKPYSDKTYRTFFQGENNVIDKDAEQVFETFPDHLKISDNEADVTNNSTVRSYEIYIDIDPDNDVDKTTANRVATTTTEDKYLAADYEGDKPDVYLKNISPNGTTIADFSITLTNLTDKADYRVVLVCDFVEAEE